MTFDDYQKAALRTASMGLGAEIEMCVRALGLAGEAAEFRDACLNGDAQAEIKEAGDVLWYTAALAAMFGVTGVELGVDELADVPHAGGASAEAYCITLMVDAAKVAELVKKQVGHHKPIKREVLVGLLTNIVRGLALASIPNLNRVAEENVAKLKARYPAGFDMAIASKKADSTERPAALYVAQNVDANGSPVEETPGHFPAGEAHFDAESGEWKPGPV